MYPAEALGFDLGALNDISRFFKQRYLTPGRLPGVLTLIARQGEVAYFEPQGLMDMERKEPVQQDTIFRIHSMAKPVTSVALMQLQEQGLVSLDDALSKFIPEFEVLQVYKAGRYPNFKTESPARPVTVKDLLTHTAGFTYDFVYQNEIDRAYRRLGLNVAQPTCNLEGFTNKLAEVPLLFSPGSAWNYSVATDVVGRLVEIISAQSLDDYFKTNIFVPLGMKDTAFYVPVKKLDRFASCYQRRIYWGKGFTLYDDAERSLFRQSPQLLGGGGGLVSTAHDYLQFCQMLLNGGELNGFRILKPQTVATMTSNHLPGGRLLTDMNRGSLAEILFNGVGFGLGFAVVVDPEKTGHACSKGEYSWGGFASTAFWIDPVEEMVVIFMTQLVPSTSYPIRRELRNLVYAALKNSDSDRHRQSQG